MTKLNEMTLLGLADFYSFCDSKHDEQGREECVKEIRRRQAMLDAADELSEIVAALDRGENATLPLDALRRYREAKK